MLDLPGLLHLMQPKCVRAALDVSSMLSFQTPSVWSVLLSIPINTWEPALMLLHLLRSPLNDNCQKKASVKLCQHNSLLPWSKCFCFGGDVCFFSLILHYRYSQGREPGSMWQIRELGHLNQSGANVLCMSHYLTQQGDSVNIRVCVEKFVLDAQVQDG